MSGGVITNEYNRFLKLPEDLKLWNCRIINRRKDEPVKFEIKFDFEMEEVQNQTPKSKFCASELFLNDVCSDIKIHCQGRIFPCHKSILVVRSKYFEACLMNDGLKESQNGIIEIEDFSPDVIEDLLKYIYTNEINEKEVTMEFFAALDKYDLAEGLDKICMEHIKSNITIENVEEILGRSYLIGCEELKMAAFEFIIDPANRKKVIPDNIWHEQATKAIANCIFLDQSK